MKNPKKVKILFYNIRSILITIILNRLNHGNCSIFNYFKGIRNNDATFNTFKYSFIIAYKGNLIILPIYENLYEILGFQHM